MGRYSLNEFITNTSQQDRGDGLFELESERLLEVNLDGLVWTKMGSMVAYKGEIRFTREGMLEHGITESRIISRQSKQREDCFQKAVIKRGLRRMRRSALRARSFSSP